MKNVVEFNEMFEMYGTPNPAFNNGELSNNRENPLYWDITRATTMESMFQYCSNFNQSMPRAEITLEYASFSYTFTSWDMERTTNLSNMFHSCTIFDGEIGSWNVRNILNYNNMFYNCTNFYQYIGGWKVLPGVNLTNMFYSTGIQTIREHLLNTPSNVTYFF